jgi:sulfur carrier protein ThiS
MRSPHTSRALWATLALVLLALALPSASFGQATRTWVSGVGDDANPCSRTAPCKTFAGAISKTASGGIIDALDDAGFGALTITKPITVDGGHHSAGLLASGGINALNVAAGVNDKIVLRNLNFEGNGTTLGLNGIRITQAASVKIRNADIGFFSRSGVSIEPNAGVTTKVWVSDSYIHDNGGNGINLAALNTANAKLVAHDNSIDSNTCGVSATTFGMTNVFATDCGTSPSTSGVSGRGTATLANNTITENSGNGVFSRGNKGTIFVGGNTLTGNGVGLAAIDSGTLLSFGNNLIHGNGIEGSATGPQIGLAKHVGR